MVVTPLGNSADEVYNIELEEVNSSSSGAAALPPPVPSSQVTVNSSSSGDEVSNIVLGEVNSSSSASDNLPKPPVVELNINNIKTKIDLGYQPLTGGDIQSIPITAMHQKGFGHCFFMAALTSTFGKIEDISTADNKQSDVLQNAITSDTNNNYTIRFFDKGTAIPVLVDNQVISYPPQINWNGRILTSANIPITNNLYGSRWKQESVKTNDAVGQPIWPAIFERAFAKFKGSYDIINAGGFEGYAMALITGKPIEYIPLQIQTEPVPGDTSNPRKMQEVYKLNDVTDFSSQGSFSTQQSKSILPNELFGTIQTALNSGQYVGAGTKGNNDKKSLYGGVLAEGHAYSVHNAYVDANGQQMILLRNPWGVDNDTNTTAPEDPSDKTDDGVVAITFASFLDNFTNVSMTK